MWDKGSRCGMVSVPGRIKPITCGTARYNLSPLGNEQHLKLQWAGATLCHGCFPKEIGPSESRRKGTVMRNPSQAPKHRYRKSQICTFRGYVPVIRPPGHSTLDAALHSLRSSWMLEARPRGTSAIQAP